MNGGTTPPFTIACLYVYSDIVGFVCGNVEKFFRNKPYIQPLTLNRISWFRSEIYLRD